MINNNNKNDMWVSNQVKIEPFGRGIWERKA